MTTIVDKDGNEIKVGSVVSVNCAEPKVGCVQFTAVLMSMQSRWLGQLTSPPELVGRVTPYQIELEFGNGVTIVSTLVETADDFIRNEKRMLCWEIKEVE